MYVGEFDFEDFLVKGTLRGEKVVVNCKTVDEAINFCLKVSIYKGLPSPMLSNWHVHKEDTCYDSDGSFNKVEYYSLKGYKVVEWSDYMESERLKKIVTVLAGVLSKNSSLPNYDAMVLDNIVSELGYYEELDRDFRW